jgi:hypothetical protein
MNPIGKLDLEQLYLTFIMIFSSITNWLQEVNLKQLILKNI